MITLHSRKLKTGKVALFAALSTLIVSGVYAQTAEVEKKEGDKDVQKLEKFEVTGSRIKQTDVEGPSPIRIVTRQDIEVSGRANLTELLRDLPESSAIGINEGGTTASVRGASALDLRNLGPNNTLVIVNGRRTVVTGANSGGITFVDTGRFPLSMVERIEVLKDGASAIYGSDATAGVVNIILRKDYNGFETNASYGNSLNTDVAEKNFSVFGGASNGKLRANLSLSYSSRGALAATDKDFSNNADLTERYAARGGDYVTLAYDYGYFDLRSGTGPQARISLKSGQVNGVNGVNIAGLASGAAISKLPGTGGAVAGTMSSVSPSFTAPSTVGTSGTFNATAAATFVPQILTSGGSGNSNLYNFQPFVWLTPSMEQKSAYATFGYDVAPGIEFYLEFNYSRKTSEIHLAPSPASTAGDNGIYVPRTNYWNPFGVDINFNYRAIEVGPRIGNIINNNYGLTTGVKGSFTAYNDFVWDWDVGFVHGYDDMNDTTSNAISESRLRAVLARTDSTALNVFGGAGFKNNPATIESIKVKTTKAGDASLSLFDAKLSGSVAKIYSGEIGAALLAEYREETFNEANDAISTTLDDIIGQVRLADSTSTRRMIHSFGAELNVPLIETGKYRGIYKLDLKAAARFEDFSDGYNSGIKPGYGIKYQPVKSLLLRASYNKTFRAPTLPQLYGGVRESLPNALPDYARPQILTGDPFDGSSTQRLVRQGGNRNLTPETATSKQFGLVYDFPFKALEGLSIEATYGEIKQENIITSVGTSFIRSNEFGSAAGLIVREPGTETYTNKSTTSIDVYTGPGTRGTPGSTKTVAPGQSITVPGRILSIADASVNLAFQRVRYYDFGLRYNKKTVSFGRFSLRSSLTYTNEYAFSKDLSVPLFNYVDTDGYPRFRLQSSVAWERKQWGASLTHNYIPSYGKPGLDGFDGYRTDNYQTFGASVSYAIPALPYIGGAKVTLGVDNLFDKAPPLYFNGVGYDQSMIGRPQGRFFVLSVQKKF